MSSPVITSPHNIQRFSVAKIARKTKAEQNQACEVRFIPGLNLFHFWEYGHEEIGSVSIYLHTVSAPHMFIY